MTFFAPVAKITLLFYWLCYLMSKIHSKFKMSLSTSTKAVFWKFYWFLYIQIPRKKDYWYRHFFSLTLFVVYVLLFKLLSGRKLNVIYWCSWTYCIVSRDVSMKYIFPVVWKQNNLIQVSILYRFRK